MARGNSKKVVYVESSDEGNKDRESSYSGDESTDIDEEGFGASGSGSNDVDEDEDSEVDVLESTSNGKKRKAPSAQSSSASKKKKNDLNQRSVVTSSTSKIAAPKTDPDTSVVLDTTFQFLKDIAKNNDRDWLHAREPVYKHALKNWNSVVDGLVPIAIEADDTLPVLPSKDLVYRIHRDVRFSNDKTPYKTNFSASLTRSGRKGPWAGYYIHIQPNNRSMIAGGKWAPDKNDLATIRHSIVNNPAVLRTELEKPAFVKLFGEAKPKKGGRSSIFGREDELKNSPKMEGVTKDHPQIDLLKCRSFVVAHTFTDSQVLDPNFLRNHVKPVMQVMAPFVQALNEIILPTPVSDSEEEDEE